MIKYTAFRGEPIKPIQAQILKRYCWHMWPQKCQNKGISSCTLEIATCVVDENTNHLITPPPFYCSFTEKWTHHDLMTPCVVIDLGHNWFRQLLVQYQLRPIPMSTYIGNWINKTNLRTGIEFSLTKIHLNISSAKFRPYLLFDFTQFDVYLSSNLNRPKTVTSYWTIKTISNPHVYYIGYTQIEMSFWWIRSSGIVTQ